MNNKLHLLIILFLSFTVPDLTASESASTSSFGSAAANTIKQPYIKLKPTDGIYKIVVLGDSLADGLYQGLTQLNKDNDQFKTSRMSRVNTGLVRVDRYDWNKGAKEIAASGNFQIAIVLLGLNDMQSFRENGKAYHFQTKGWVERYQARIEEMMGDLKAAKLAVYWTGIPITAPRKFQEEYGYLNAFYQQAAQKLGVRFVDTWDRLADEEGAYSPFWRGADGKLQEIRNKDGVHFTPGGYQIFAGIVNDTLMSDLNDNLPSVRAVLEPVEDPGDGSGNE